MKSLAYTVSGLLAAACLSAACGGEDVSQTEDGTLVLGRAEVEEVVQRGVAPGNRTLILNGFVGDITLSGTEGTAASLEFVKRARGDDAEEARGFLGEITIEESGDNQAYRYVMSTEEPGRTAVDVRGEVPRNVNLEIQMEGGSITLSGTGGPITIRQANGNVQIGGAAAGVQVEVLNGTVEAGYRMLPSDAGVDLNVSNGNLILTLPASSSARVDAQTSAGSINVGPGLEFVNRQLNPQGAGTRFSGQLGQGTASVRLRTENGSITLQEGTVTDLGGVPALPADTAFAVPADTALAVPADTSGLP